MNHEHTSSWIDRIGLGVMVIFLGLLPIFFLALTQEYYDTNKWLLLAGTTIFLLILWGLRVLMTGTITIAWNGTTKRLGVVACIGLVSLLVSSNKVEAVIAPFGAGTLLALFMIALIGATFLDEKGRHALRWILFSTVSLAGLLAIYQFFGLGKLMFPSVAFLADPLWTPVGTSVGLMTILIVTLPIIASEVLNGKRAGHDTHMTVAMVMGLASLGGLILTAYQALPNMPMTTLPFWVNWQILLESYKNWQQLLVGVGAQNFLSAFTDGRPASLNMTPIWNIRFTMGSSMLFHVATVYGLIGTAAFVWLLSSMRGTLIPAALSLIFLPPSFPALIVIATLLILSEPSSLKRSHLFRLTFRYGLVMLILFLFAAASYGLYRAYAAEVSFAQSLKAIASRDGTSAYTHQIQAITLNPRVTRFHTTYSQTNLALANALASTTTASATPDQVDKDRQTTTQLIQQAIREAKIAVNLAPKNIIAWENLASVYQTLTGVAQGADQWAVAAYSQTVTLDPTNPVLRLRLGGAYVGQQKLDAAAESYALAIRLKPDYANAYYNLAFSYREQKKYMLAAQALKETLRHVTPGTDDGSRAQQELDELRDLLTEQEKQTLDEPTTTGMNQPRATPVPSSNATTEPLSPLP